MNINFILNNKLKQALKHKGRENGLKLCCWKVGRSFLQGDYDKKYSEHKIIFYKFYIYTSIYYYF